MEVLSQYWPSVVGVVVWPLAQWIKNEIPADVPIASTAIAWVLSFLLAWLASVVLSLHMTGQEIVIMVMATKGVGEVTHSVSKTIQKNTMAGVNIK